MSTDTPIHSEKQEFPFRTGIAIIEFLVFACIPVFLKLPWWMSVGILIIGLLAAALTSSVMILRIEITTSKLEFGYWFSSPNIPLSDIRNPQVVEIPKLAGIGMHFYRGCRVYNARFGRGIQFSLSNNKKYMVGSNDPEQLLSMLRSVVPRENG